MAFDVTNIGTGGSTSGATFTIPVPVGGVPGGKTIVVCVSDRNNAQVIGSQSVSDTAGNAYTRVAVSNNQNCFCSIYVAKNVVALAAGDTITITKATTDHAAASAFYAAANADPVNAAVTTTANGGSTQPLLTTAATPGAGELVVACSSTAPIYLPYTQSSGFTTPPLEGTSGASSSDRVIDGGTLVADGSSSYTYAPVYGTAPFAWAACVISLKPATGGGTTESRTLTASGTGAASFGGASLNAQSFSATGSASVSFSAGGVASASLSAAGSSATSFTGAAVAVASLSATGTAVASFVGGSDISGSAALAAAGTSSVTFRSGAIIGRTLDANGSSSVQFGAAWLQTTSVSFNAAGIGAASFALPIVVPIDAGSATGPARDILASRARRITRLASPQRRISMLGRR